MLSGKLSLLNDGSFTAYGTDFAVPGALRMCAWVSGCLVLCDNLLGKMVFPEKNVFRHRILHRIPKATHGYLNS